MAVMWEMGVMMKLRVDALWWCGVNGVVLLCVRRRRRKRKRSATTTLCEIRRPPSQQGEERALATNGDAVVFEGVAMGDWETQG
jgi:hypothetical protein